jgi:saccharopine dehydrogenase-like NADP-dependent oxidoreductase
VDNTAALEEAVASHDLVVSLIPYTYHAAVIKAAIKGKTHVVTTSYVSPAMHELDAEAQAAGIVVFNEIGLDPGIDHLYAVKTIDEVHEKGGKVLQFLSYCTGLPAPECADNPLGYKFSWSSRGVLLALLNNAGYVEGGKEVYVEGKGLMGVAKPYFVKPGYAFVAYPNRNSVPFREYYNIPEAQACIRGTLRYQGFPEFIKALVDMGFLDTTEKDWLSEKLSWAEVTQKALGASDASES